jgi:hypothetical protein
MWPLYLGGCGKSQRAVTLIELPELSDNDKRALAERLVRDGYLHKDERGRYLLTLDGHRPQRAAIPVFSRQTWQRDLARAEIARSQEF